MLFEDSTVSYIEKGHRRHSVRYETATNAHSDEVHKYSVYAIRTAVEIVKEGRSSNLRLKRRTIVFVLVYVKVRTAVK